MNLHRLDLNLLVVMDALLADPSVTNAARRLKVTQPAISMSLKKLRDFFKDELFIRTPTGLRATPYAEQLREPVRRAIDVIDVEIVKRRNFDPLTTQQVFHISTSDAGELSCLPLVLAKLRERAPNASILNRSIPPGRLASVMENGDIDVAIGYFPDLDIPTFFHQKLFDHKVVCLVRQGHPFIRDKITVQQFLQAEHAIVTDVGREQDAFEKITREMGLKRRIKVRLAHLLSVPILVAGSDLIAVVPLSVGAPYAHLGELQLLPPPMPIPPIEIKQYWHRRVNREPSVVWFRKLLGELFRGRDPTGQPETFAFRSSSPKRNSK